MAGTTVQSGPGNRRTNGPGGTFPDKSNHKSTPKHRLKSSSVKFGKFIDKRSSK